MNFLFSLEEGALRPTRAHSTDAGLDIYAPKQVAIKPYDQAFVKTGLHIQLPENTVGFIKSRSGMMKKLGVTTDGTIDEGYTGEIGVILFNHTNDTVVLPKHSKIAQLVIVPCIYAHPVEVYELGNDTERGNNGFGSTGR